MYGTMTTNKPIAVGVVLHVQKKMYMAIKVNSFYYQLSHL